MNTAPAMKATIRRSVSSRAGASLSQRTQTAAMRASLQLVRKRASTRGMGQSAGSSPARCAGNAASR